MDQFNTLEAVIERPEMLAEGQLPAHFGQVGLLVDQVGDVYSFDQTRIDPTPANVSAGHNPYLLGVYRAADLLLGVLNLDALLAI